MVDRSFLFGSEEYHRQQEGWLGPVSFGPDSEEGYEIVQADDRPGMEEWYVFHKDHPAAEIARGVAGKTVGTVHLDDLFESITRGY